MRRWLAPGALAAVAVLFLLRLNHGLWIPEEVDAELRPWLDAAVMHVSFDGAPSPLGVRAGHVILSLAGLVAVWFAARALARRAGGAATLDARAGGAATLDARAGDGDAAGWLAVALLVAAPAFVLAGRSAAGGIAAIAPVAVATWGVVALREEPSRRSLALAGVGTVLAVGGIGILGAFVPLAAIAALGPAALRERRAEVPIAWIATAAVVLAAGLAGIALAAALGGRLWPEGGGSRLSILLGLLPLGVMLPACAVVRSRDPRRAELLVHAIAWLSAALVWPGDPWLRLAAAVPLALFVTSSIALPTAAGPTSTRQPRAADSANRLLASATDTGSAERIERRLLAIAVAVTSVTIAAAAAFAFHRSPARLVGAHLPDPTALDEVALSFGQTGWILLGIAGAAAAWWRTRAVAIAATGALAWTAALHGAPAVSARRSFDPLIEAAAAHGAPITDARTNAGEALALLDGATCRSVILPVADLVDIERARRGRFVVLAAIDRFVVATACPRLVASGPNVDPLRDTLLERVPPKWGKPTDAAFAGLHLRAVRMADRVRRGVREVDAAFAFDVTGPLADGDRVALRIDGCRRTATFDQPLALSPAQLRRGDVVVHRVRLPLGDLPPCRYKVGVAWGASQPAVVKAFELR
jgi:hypothetical protein